MTILLDGATYLATRIDVKTQHEGSPVVMAIDYQKVPNGPSTMARMMVQIPKEDIVVNVESFDFRRLAVPRAALEPSCVQQASRRTFARSSLAVTPKTLLCF